MSIHDKQTLSKSFSPGPKNHWPWDHRVHCVISENTVLLMHTLEGVSSVANFITAFEESH